MLLFFYFNAIIIEILNFIAQMSSLFRLIVALARLDGNEATLGQVAQAITPTICRPIHSAFMSIKHMGMLSTYEYLIAYSFHFSKRILRKFAQ